MQDLLFVEVYLLVQIVTYMKIYIHTGIERCVCKILLFVEVYLLIQIVSLIKFRTSYSYNYTKLLTFGLGFNLVIFLVEHLI